MLFCLFALLNGELAPQFFLLIRVRKMVLQTSRHHTYESGGGGAMTIYLVICFSPGTFPKRIANPRVTR